MNRNQTDKFAAVCGMIWFIFIIDACFTWFFTWRTRYFMGAPFMFVATIALYGNNGLSFSKQRLSMFISILLLAAFMFLVKRQFVIAIIRYTPMMCLIFWRPSALHQMYVYLKKFIIFYAILSLFVELLVLTRLWKVLPHMILPPQDEVQRQLGYVNYFYGLFSIQSVDYNLSFFRTCGPGREGGHWAIYLGFLYFSEKAIYNKRNIWVIISGSLSLSPNFLIAFFVTEGYCGIVQKKIEKSMAIFLGTILLIMTVFTLSPKKIQDEVVRVIFERSLDRSIESLGSEGLMAIINERTGHDQRGLLYFDRFMKNDTFTVLTGGKVPKDNTMSDYRMLIMHIGFIGVFLVLWCIFVFSFKTNKGLFGLCLLVMGLAVFAHRSWMYFNCYWWTMMLLINNEYKCSNLSGISGRRLRYINKTQKVTT